jgi:hypothetical protein
VLAEREVLKYCVTFGLAAVYISPTGKIRVGLDPKRAGAVAAWWTREDDARRIVEFARTLLPRMPPPLAIEHAARKLGVGLTSHATAMARGRAALAKISNGLDKAQAAGVLATFNSEFKRRRLEAKASGSRFMRYAVARRRLEQALAGVAAGEATAGVVAKVFESEPGKTVQRVN